MEETLVEQLKARRYQGSVVSIQRLHDLKASLKSIHERGFLDEEFYLERLTGFNFEPPEELPKARSLIVVAYRDPQVRFTFEWRGERKPLVVPPTYLHWKEKDESVNHLLTELLEPAGFQVVQAFVPKKLLAVCSGLAMYGKNNLTYVNGTGSFHRMAVFCSDLPVEGDTWREPQMMEICEQCQGCARSCPTQAITLERFLLRAERCITYWNEKPGQIDFPHWLEASWHNCLVGCMHCQRICPENKHYLEYVEDGASFSEDETALLLQGTTSDELPTGLALKLKENDLIDFLDILPRNLSILLKNHEERVGDF